MYEYKVQSVNIGGALPPLLPQFLRLCVSAASQAKICIRGNHLPMQGRNQLEIVMRMHGYESLYNTLASLCVSGKGGYTLTE